MDDLKPTVPHPERGKLGRQEAAELALFEAIDQELEKNPPEGTYDASACAYNVMDTLAREDAKRWPSLEWHAAFRHIIAMVQRRLLREIKQEARADARQGLLALPGFELVSPWVRIEDRVVPLKKATVEQHRESVKERARRIRKMEYPRWSEERMAREKAALAQERKLDRGVMPLTGGNLEMGMESAMELFQAKLESPSMQAKIKGGKTGGRGRKRRTQNQ